MKPKERPNIVFLMLDTLRADVLSTYGGSTRMETLDGIAKDGAVYERAIAPGTYTVPSHLSLFTNKRVRQIHTLTKKKITETDPFMVNKYVQKGELTLARHMSYLGYKTALFSNNPFLSEQTGLAEGFSHVENLFFDEKMANSKIKMILKLVDNKSMSEKMIKLACYVSKILPEKQLDRTYINLRRVLNRHFAKESGYYKLDQGASRTNSILNRYCADAGARGNFIFINYMEAHDGYPTNMVSDSFVEQDKWLYISKLVDPENAHILKEAYKKRLVYLDTKLKELMSTMKKNGTLDDAVLVIAGDHGQAFMEHGQMYHGIFPYNEVVQVPLIAARFRNGRQVRQSERVEKTVGLSALYDSILKIGYGSEEMVDGSLRRDNFVFSDHIGIPDVWDTPILTRLKERSESARKIYKTKAVFDTSATAIYYKNYKLIHYYSKRMKDELYDISADQREEENLIGEKRRVALEMLSHNRGS